MAQWNTSRRSNLFFQLDKLNLDKIDKQIMCQREYEKYRRGYEFPTVRVQLEVEQKKNIMRLMFICP